MGKQPTLEALSLLWPITRRVHRSEVRSYPSRQTARVADL